jgi:hypothetical protein
MKDALPSEKGNINVAGRSLCRDWLFVEGDYSVHAGWAIVASDARFMSEVDWSTKG